ncbi:hypothetical protein A8M77_23470 [Variovorax sp. JS1663]|nr:hypothetical protein A8M77_23470 [Variovorax sp. JS1663]
MTSQQALLEFIAALLKFSAVPAAAFELMSKERRARTESWLVGRLPKLIKAFLVTLVVLNVCVALLVKAGPYLFLLFFLFGGLISTVMMLSLKEDQLFAYLATVFAFIVAGMVAAALEKWVIPEAWIVTMGRPFEAVSAWANTNPYVDWLLPDYSGQAFLENFRSFFSSLEHWLWSWLAFVWSTYFFFARGVMVLMVALIQLLLAVGVVAGAIVAVGGPLYLFMKFSDYTRLKLDIDKDRIPVGAFFFWATGETIEFGLKAYVALWKASQ